MWNDDEDIEDYFDEERDRQAAIERYEEMLKTNGSAYFDSAEFEFIIDHYVEKNQLRLSRQAIELALQQHPGSNIIKIKEARQYLLEGQAENAFQILQHVDRDEDDDLDYFLILGSCLAALGKSRDAIESYCNALPYFDEDEKYELYHAIGYEYQKLDKFDLAIEFYEKALALANDDNNGRDNIYQEIRHCFLCQQRLDDAIAYFQRLVDKNPHDSKAWTSIGDCYRMTGDYEQSIDPYEYSLAIDPTDLWTNGHLADIYYDLGRYKESIDTLKEALRNGVESSTLHVALGDAYLSLEDLPLAEEHFRKATELSPLNGGAWSGLGYVASDRADFKTSIKYFEKALELEPWVSDHLYALADDYRKLNQPDTAMQYLRKIQEEYPNDPDSYYYMADIYGEMDQVDEAINILQYGLMQTNNDANLLYLLAYAYFVKGNRHKGLLTLDEALDANFEIWPEFIDYDKDLLLNDDDIVLMIEQHRIQHEQNSKDNA